MSIILAALIVGLGADDFYTRQACSQALSPFGYGLIAVRSDDPEVCNRLRIICEDWRSSYRPTKYKVTPWIDCLPIDYLDREAVIGRLLGEYWWGDDDGYMRYRTATERLIDELIVKGKSKTEIIDLLDKMVIRELDLIEHSFPHLKGMYD